MKIQKTSLQELLLSNENVKNVKTKYRRKYVFSNRDYWSDERQQYPDIQSRRKKFKDQSL